MGEESKLDFGLTHFAGDRFDVQGFVDAVCSQGVDVETLDLVWDPLDRLEDDLRQGLGQVEKMSVAVGARLEKLSEENERLSRELADLVRVQKREQEAAAKQFRALERRFGRSSDTAIQIGSRLNHLDTVRQRALRGRAILQYFDEFMMEKEVRNPLFLDFPRTLVETAPVICDLEKIVDELSVPGIEQGAKRIKETSERVFSGLLDEFQKATADGDLEKMSSFANAVIKNFAHKNGSNLLFQRFVDHTLQPIVEARKRSIAFRNAALKDNLAHLFSQIRSIVRSTHVIVGRAFPAHINEVLALLVGKLFKDSTYGLQSMLHEFLFPIHRDGQLPHNEYLQILVTAHYETNHLRNELAKGFQSTQNRSNLSYGNQDASEVESDSKQKARGVVDSNFTYQQMKSVFQHYTVDYGFRELKLFEQRVSKRLYASLPHRVLALSCPDLEPPPEVVNQQKKKEMLQQSKTGEVSPVREPESAGSPSQQKRKDKKSAKGKEPENPFERQKLQFRSDPVGVYREILAEDPDINVTSIMYRTLQLRTSWKSDLRAVTLEDLCKFVETQPGERWSLDEIDKVIASVNAPEPLAATGDLSEFEAQQNQKEPEKKTFASTFYELRGVPGQMIRWTFEAHNRCIDLLGSKVTRVLADKDRVKSGMDDPFQSQPQEQEQELPAAFLPVALKNSDDNKIALDTLEDIFHAFCDRFFLVTLGNVIQLVMAHLPEYIPVQITDTSTLSKPSSEELELFGHMDPAPPCVIGLTAPKLHPASLPALASNHVQVKASGSQIANLAETRSDFGEALVPEQLKLFVAVTHALEDCTTQALLYWRDVVFPSLSEIPNRSSSCQAFMENRLKRIEQLVGDAIYTQLEYASILLQACAVGLHRPQEYSPKEEMSSAVEQTSQWVMIACQVLTGYLNEFSRMGNGAIRDSCLLNLSFAARDVLLGVLKRAKVSYQGAFTLFQDISFFSRTVLENPFCARNATINQMWSEMRSIGHLFIVQPEALPSFFREDESLVKLDRRFLYECLCKRADSKVSSTTSSSRAPWVRQLFILD